MTKPKFYYNSKTCQYEQAKVRWIDVVGYALSVLMVGFLFFAGLILLYNKFVETNTEVALRKENATLEKHKVLLASQLNDAEGFLDQLAEKESALSSTLFETDAKNDKAAHKDNKVDVLTADGNQFERALDELKSRTNAISEKSSGTNTFFGSHAALTKEDLARIPYVPSLVPVKNFSPEIVSSGFGMRVNPFHKGLYKHPGVDFISPRGTEVVASATGTVTEIRKSDLQAGYGNFIEIDHGKGFVTHYSHLQDVNVRQGQKVTKGMVIGSIGNSGGSIAPHLHYEVIHNGKNTDPVLYMVEGLSSDAHQLLKERSAKKNQSLD